MGDRFIPNEPEDVQDVDEARRWVRIYVLAHTELTKLVEEAPSPQLLSRVLATSARLSWWQRREAELAAAPGSAPHRGASGS